MDNNNKEVENFDSNIKRFAIWALVMIIIWGSIWYLFYIKADEVTKDPCSICAKKMGEDVYCTVKQGNLLPLTRTYGANGSIVDNEEEIRRLIDEQIEKNNPWQLGGLTTIDNRSVYVTSNGTEMASAENPNNINQMKGGIIR